MFRDTDKELARLEAELLKEEEPMEEDLPEEAYPEEELPEYLYTDTRAAAGPVIYQNYSNEYGSNLRNYASGYRAYNSDISDADLEDYSEDVHQGTSDGSTTTLVIIACLLALGIAGFLLFWLLRSRGIL